MNNERLGYILLKNRIIDDQELDFCLSVQKNNGNQRLGQLLCHYNFTDEVSVAKALASQVGWQFFDDEYVIDDSMVLTFGREFFIDKKVFPLKNSISPTFVISKTNDTLTTDIITQKLGFSPVFYIGLEKSLNNALSRIIVNNDHINDVSINYDDLNKWFESCLKKAIACCASDIHIESSQKVVEIRFRIDGVLVFIETMPLNILSRLINIIFHRAEVTISDFGHFHDSKFIFDSLNRPIDVRISHIPSVNGSSLVLRLLDKGKSVMKLSDLGYGARSWQLIEENLIKPEGVILVVGPTGCGKTTTLYAMLNYLKSISRKIVTVEDPVEIQLPLMMQVQVNEKKGISFSQTARAFLRHDPDIVLIGEIRDQQTAQEVLRMSMTGHQVLTTLHTNRALDALLRLNDLGIPLSHLADHISIIIAQRLVRKLCPSCKEIKSVKRSDLLSQQIKYLNGIEQDVFIPKGCSFCRSGFMGQTIVSEVLPINEIFSEFIAKGDLFNLRRLLKDGRHPTMLDDARRLVSEGITSLDEVQRVLG